MSGLLKFAAGLFLFVVIMSTPVVREITLCVILFVVTYTITMYIWVIAWGIIANVLDSVGIEL